MMPRRLMPPFISDVAKVCLSRCGVSGSESGMSPPTFMSIWRYVCAVTGRSRAPSISHGLSAEPSRRSCAKRRDGGRIERYQALVVELAERHLQKAAADVVLADAVTLEATQFADAQARPAHQKQTERDGRFFLLEPLLELPIGVGR